MINKILLHFIAIIPFTGISCNHASNVYKDITLIEINFVNKDILTPFSISCGNFETSFESTYKKTIIEDANEIGLFKNCLVKSKERDSGDIDVRTKVYMYNSNKEIISTLCYDRFDNIILDDKTKLQNRCPVDYIDKKIEGK